MTPTCLLIDNDIDDQEIFCLALKEIDQSLECEVASDGLTAIRKLKENRTVIPAYIFIDMNMPLMNGKQCLQEIKKIPHLSQVPVYIYSTAADPYSIQEAKELGATDFIMKPAGFQQLVDLLARIFRSNKILP